MISPNRVNFINHVCVCRCFVNEQLHKLVRCCFSGKEFEFFVNCTRPRYADAKPYLECEDVCQLISVRYFEHRAHNHCSSGVKIWGIVSFIILIIFSEISRTPPKLAPSARHENA